jgi:hypothetical protein
MSKQTKNTSEEPLPSAEKEKQAADDQAASKEATEEAVSGEVAPAETSYLVLKGPASFGPIIVSGRAVRAKRGVPIVVSDPDERLAILGTGRFVAAKSTPPPRTPGGPVTMASLPPGARRGGPKR